MGTKGRGQLGTGVDSEQRLRQTTSLLFGGDLLVLLFVSTLCVHQESRGGGAICGRSSVLLLFLRPAVRVCASRPMELAQLQARVEELERENAELRQTVKKGRVRWRPLLVE